MPYPDRNNGAADPVTNAPLQGSVGTVAALGAAQGTAAPLPYAVNKVTGADAAKGVILPDIDGMRLGTRIIVINAAAAALLVYPATGGTINAAAANAAVSVAANAVAEFIAFGEDVWWGPESPQA
jgi:hypothetical protein